MTDDEMFNGLQLKEMLSDESSATLSDILGAIKKLPRFDKEGESLKVATPVDILHGYFSPHCELLGISEHYFWSLNNKCQEGDFKDYFECIDAVPDVNVAASVMRLMVWGMGKEDCKDTLAAFSAQIPSFLSDEKWNGNISAFLAMRGAIDCVDYKQEGQANVVLSIVRNRSGLERAVAAIASISLVVRALSGNLDEEAGWRGTAGHSRQIQLLDLYRALVKENEEHLTAATFHVVAPLLFGLDLEHDWKKTEECRNTGLPVETRVFSYAEAMIVACASGIGLTREECVKVCTLALYCGGRSHIWRQKVFRSVAMFMANLVAKFSDSEAVWRDICKNTRGLIYRGLHEYHTGATASLSERVEIFVGVAYLHACQLADKNKQRDAIEVWASAWNNCVTALYAMTLRKEFVTLIQYFFLRACLCFTNETEFVPSGYELLKQLPLVELTPDERIDCAEVCVRALIANLDDVARARIQKKDPELWKLINANGQTGLRMEHA